MNNICLKCGNSPTEDDLDVRYNHNEIIECGKCCDTTHKRDLLGNIMPNEGFKLTRLYPIEDDDE